MKAYRVVNWKIIGEVTSAGKAATENTSEDNLRLKKPIYARLNLSGHALEPKYRRLAKKAYGIGKMMEMACIGLFIKLLDLAGDWDDPKLRGWILDDLKRPMDAYAIAELFEIRDKEHVAAAMELLCDPEIGMLEEVEFDLIPQISSSEGGNEVKQGELMTDVPPHSPDDGGNEVNPLYNETETEERSLNLNETERGSPGFPEPGGKGVEPTAAPASALVSDSVSEIPASASDSAPRQGLRSVEDIKKESAKIILQITELKGLRPKTQSDYTTYSDIFEQLRNRVIYDTDEPLFEKALIKAKQCCRVGDHPIRMFVAAMKKTPFCYVPQRKSIIRGAIDKYRH